MSWLWLSLGGLAWSGSEYAIHRFVGHGPLRKPAESALGKLMPAGLAAEFNAEHVAHHADTTYFAANSRKVRAAAAALPVIGMALTPFVGVRRASSFALGFGIVYGAYEVLHRRIHTRPPSGPFGRWARKNHLLHHHRTPRLNHGVTSPIWDLVLRTSSSSGRVRIPRHAAPVWMTDPRTGDLLPAYASDYELVSFKERPRDRPRPEARSMPRAHSDQLSP